MELERDASYPEPTSPNLPAELTLFGVGAGRIYPDAPYAESGLSVYERPVVQVAGSVLSDVWRLVSFGALPLPQQRSRKRSVPAPFGPRTAIQYDVPAAIDAAGSGRRFHVPSLGAESVACASSVLGCPEKSA
jgi:hypothetical protein